MWCEVGGRRIYYESCGDGRPALMIHGFGIDHHVMTGCMEPLFRDRPGWRRIYPDLPGMGQSPAGEVKNADQMLDVLIRFAEQVAGPRYAVAGESYGGYLARGLVYRVPERLSGLLLLCPVVIAPRERRRLPARAVFAREEAALDSMPPDVRKLFERTMVLQDRRRRERFQQDIVPGMQAPARDEAFLRQFMREGYSFSFDVDRLERPFTKPALLLAGRQDASVGWQDLLAIAGNYHRGSIAVLDRAGHGLEVEQETVFNCLANEWLDRIEGEEAKLKLS